VNERRAEGVLLTGIYGSGKSSVRRGDRLPARAAGEPYALLDLDYPSWAGTGTGDRASEFGLMLHNLAAVAANYRRAGIRLFVLAYFVRSPGEVGEVRKALGLPLRVARLTLGLREIQQRLGSDVTSGRRDDMRAAAESIAAAEGTGVEDVVISNDRPIGVVAQDVMTFLGWGKRRRIMFVPDIRYAALRHVAPWRSGAPSGSPGSRPCGPPAAV
jgi:hypothetical protein